MHGRRIALAAALLTLAAAPAAAHADETLGLGQSASTDGVVTSWKTTTGGAQGAVRLRSLQALGGGGTATTATTDPAAVVQGVATAARLPIGRGGTLTLLGASGSPTVAATVEPDADGDGYGDTTQDACPADFTSHDAPCPGTVTVGDPLTLAPDPRGLPSGELQAFAHLGANPAPASHPWVLVRWRLRAAPGAGATRLQVLTRTGANTWMPTYEDGQVDATGTGVVSFPGWDVINGDFRIAARSVSGDLGAVAFASGEDLDTRQPPVRVVDAASFTPNGSAADSRLLVQADLEPDQDHDGRGDVTQDSADLRLSGTADGARHTYTVRNAGPDMAFGVVLTLQGGGTVADPPSGATCTGATTCRIESLASGASVTVTTSFAGATGTVASSASVSAFPTPDPDTTNNSAALTSAVPFVYRTPPPAGKQQPFVVIACANVVRGTRDDDVLRGTAFGDRLVGGDGADLLKGDAANDCLEGGSGNDVLDGGNGDDRLAGDAGSDRLTGGNGADRLTGGRGNDRLSGGSGDDVLSPGAGKDTISAGPGNDTINSVDGVRETVDCGSGRDTVRADRRDHLIHCERITRKR